MIQNPSHEQPHSQDAMNAETAFYARHAHLLDLTAADPARNAETLGKFDEGGRYGAVSFALERMGPFASALEIGCGMGDASRHLASKVPKVVGTDLVLLPNLVQNAGDRLSFVEANANDRFPFEDGRFDLVIAMMVMEHVFDPFHFCAEVARILKPGGVFVLNVPLVTSLRHRLALMRGRLPVTSSKDWFAMREWDGGHLHYFSIATLDALLACCGLEVERRFGVGRMHRLKSLWPSLLASEVSYIARRPSRS